MRVKIIYYYLPKCMVCKAFEKRVLIPLYKRGDINLIKIDVSIEPEVKKMRLPLDLVNHRLHYDVACSKSDAGCVVPAVEIVLKETEDEYESEFIFTRGDENEFEKEVIKAVENISMRMATVVY